MYRLIAVFLLTVLAGCRSAESGAPFYVDVRTPEEYAVSHVRGAINIPLEQIRERWRELEPHTTDRIMVYCRSGRRSALALAELKELGFVHAEDAGAMQNLVAAGVLLE